MLVNHKAMQERTHTFVVSIKLDNGESIKVHQVGHSHWEAIDRVFNKYHHVYPYNVNRSSYTASKKYVR